MLRSISLRLAVAAGMILNFSLVVLLAADDLKSGPQPGEPDKPNKLPGSFQALNVVGLRAGRFHCPVVEHGLNPVVLVFSRQEPPEDMDKPLAKLIKQLDEAVGKHRDLHRLGAAVVFLKGDYRKSLEVKLEEPEEIIEYLKEKDPQKAKEKEPKKLLAFIKEADTKDLMVKKIQDLGKGLAVQHLALSLDSDAGPENWAVHKDADVTVVMYLRHNVLANFAYTADKALTEEDLKVIMATLVDKLLPPRKKPDLKPPVKAAG